MQNLKACLSIKMYKPFSEIKLYQKYILDIFLLFFLETFFGKTLNISACLLMKNLFEAKLIYLKFWKNKNKITYNCLK